MYMYMYCVIIKTSIIIKKIHVFMEVGLDNNLYCITIIVSHDFGLPILSQWQNIVLLQLNNSFNICSCKIL